MGKRILLVEDDKALGLVLKNNLQYEGFEVEWCETANAVVPKVREFAPHVVLLDLMLPQGADGIQVCRLLTKGRDRIPVIILTARGEPEEKIRGLRSGADDYVTKPFSFEELLARIQALLRRSQGRLDYLHLGKIFIDFRKLRAYKDKVELPLTDREFELLRHLGERKGEVVTRDELLRLVWGYTETSSRTVDNFVFRLRHKIEEDPRRPKFIRTSYGDGYRLTVGD